MFQLNLSLSFHNRFELKEQTTSLKQYSGNSHTHLLSNLMTTHNYFYVFILGKVLTTTHERVIDNLNKKLRNIFNFISH